MSIGTPFTLPCIHVTTPDVKKRFVCSIRRNTRYQQVVLYCQRSVSVLIVLVQWGRLAFFIRTYRSNMPNIATFPASYCSTLYLLCSGRLLLNLQSHAGVFIDAFFQEVLCSSVIFTRRAPPRFFFQRLPLLLRVLPSSFLRHPGSNCREWYPFTTQFFIVSSHYVVVFGH